MLRSWRRTLTQRKKPEAESTASGIPDTPVRGPRWLYAGPGEDQPGLRAGALSLGLRLGALISGTIEIDRLAVDRLYARLVSAPEAERVDTSGMSDRELDAFYAARREMREQGASGAGAALALPLALNVGELLLNDARIESIDAASGEATLIDVPRFKAEGLNLDGTPIPLSLELQVPGETVVVAQLEGTVSIDQVSPRNSP